MEKFERDEVTLSALAVFPPELRVAALESKSFRDQLNVNIDAVIQLDQSGVEFRRSVLFKCMRQLLGGQESELEVADTKLQRWKVTADTEQKRICITRSEKQHWLPDFYSLHPSSEQRLAWLDGEVERAELNEDSAIGKWRDILANREVDDNEVDELLHEFRLAPRYVATSIRRHLRQKNISVENLVPGDLVYYDRLVGPPSEGDDLRSFFDRLSVRISSSLKSGNMKLQEAFLFSSHPFGPQEIGAHDLPATDISEFFKWLVAGGDRFSQVGGTEWGLKNLALFPDIENNLEELVGILQSDDLSDELSRLNLLSGLIALTDGEIARTGICRKRPPFWRRLASIAHASVLERVIVAENFLPSDFVEWCRQSRGLHFYLQTFVDMRREPRWIPDLLSAEQLKHEFVGRIACAAPANFSSTNHSKLGKLFDRNNADSVPAAVQFPFSFLPGPLEGGFSAMVSMPEDIREIVNKALKVETLTAKSFIPLVNSSLIYVLDDEFAQLAAEGLKRAKHDLPQIKSSNESFHLLSGLATVAAVSRSTKLADETRVLMRVVRRKPDIMIEPENALRIGLIAAAAHTDLKAWCKYIGELLTELAYEEMPQNCVSALYQFLEVLRQLEPALWLTTSRAEAALRAYHPLAAPERKQTNP